MISHGTQKPLASSSKVTAKAPEPKPAALAHDNKAKTGNEEWESF
jgi:hypothetical protein